MNTTTARQRGIAGLILADENGECLISIGIGQDERLQNLVSDTEWLADALRLRLKPILLNDAEFAALVTRIDRHYLLLLSEPHAETVLQFLLNVDFAYDIIEHVLTDPYDAMAIVDAEEKLAFISPVHEKFFGLRANEGIGKRVRDVIENTRLPHVVRTGVAEVGQVHRMKGRDRIVSRHPILHDNKVVGAIGRIMFKGPQQVEAMSRRINALEEEIATYKSRAVNDPRDDFMTETIIGESFAIRSVREQIRKIAPLDIPVLIQGESGTGKELVAQALHRLSSRQDARLVTVNAAALPESLVESELFGYEAGSFTGAARQGRAGKFEQADKGTIFLDEIGDMPLEVQTKLLRVLQDRMIERIGGDKPKRVDFRFCSATNHDLDAFVADGKFRLDLYYRISPVCIYVPPLAERLDDIPLLLNRFVDELATRYNREVPEIDIDVSSYLMAQTWPGNIRQLRHAIERAFVFAERGRLTVADFTSEHGSAAARRRALPATGGQRPLKVNPDAGSLKDSLEDLATQLIADAMIRFKGNKKKTAEHLGISRSYLYKKLESIDDDTNDDQ